LTGIKCSGTIGLLVALYSKLKVNSFGKGVDIMRLDRYHLLRAATACALGWAALTGGVSASGPSTATGENQSKPKTEVPGDYCFAIVGRDCSEKGCDPETGFVAATLGPHEMTLYDLKQGPHGECVVDQ
jgi:hypothetical protein